MSLAVPDFLNIADEFVWRPARSHPERVAILGEPSRFTYADVAFAVNRAANVFRSWGCQPGNRVLIVLPDSLEFIAAFFGAAKIGAIAVPVNSMARAADYSYYLADSGARIAIVHVSALPEFSQISGAENLNIIAISGAQSGGSRDAVKLGNAFDAVEEFNWDAECAQAIAKCESHPTEADDPAFFLYTSGSGGTPKAAIHRHEDMVHTSRGYAHGVLQLRPGDITYSVSKLFF